MDPTKTDQVFELPVAAVAQLGSYVPEKVDDAPIICYPQHGEGSCGISAFSSAFFYMFDKDLGAKIYSQKKGYMESLSTPAEKKSKKAPSMKFLTNLVWCKAFKKYYILRMKQIKPWKEIYN